MTYSRTAYAHIRIRNNCVKTQLKIIEQLESPPLSLQPGMAAGAARGTPINRNETCAVSSGLQKLDHPAFVLYKNLLSESK